MNYADVLTNARERIGEQCKVCAVCDGRACRNRIPGPGAKGIGETAIRNYEGWQKIYVNMDTLHETFEPDTGIELFGKKFRFPFFAGPVGAVNMHYSDYYNDVSFNKVLVNGCADAGIAAFTGDGMDASVIESATEAINLAGGIGIPTIKPWSIPMIREKIDRVNTAEPLAIAMDVDAAGLPFLKGFEPPAGAKSVEELTEICRMAGRAFIVKGVMTVAGAEKAEKAGASAIVVSNHGGRVLDMCPSTSSVLPEITEAVGGRMKIFVDGGIRTGTDVFKALALGADAVVIARTFVTAVYGGAEEGVRAYVEKLGSELADTMVMCGAKDLSAINREMIRF